MSLILTLFTLGAFGQAEKYMTRNGNVHFKSHAEVDDGVEAINRSAACVLNTETGEIVFQVAMKAFHFEKALMEEHYNENYLETSQFPKSSLKGTIIDFSPTLLDGESHEIQIAGEFNLHGVTQTITEKGTIRMENGNVILESSFKVPLEAYEIEIPKMVQDKIAREIDVDLKMKLEKV